MTADRWYILNEAKTIEKDCLKKHISADEWVKRYAIKYRRTHANGISLIKDDHGHIYTAIEGSR